MNMYVMRLAKGHEGGLLHASCPINYKKTFENHVISELANTELGQIPYDTNNYLEYIHRELWQCGKLRQGWGIQGLDLFDVIENAQDEERWINKYIIGLKKYWNTDPLDSRNGYSDTYTPCHEASGRMKMLSDVLLNAKPHDVVFIPKHSFENHHDDHQFTVCEVIGKYYFDLNEAYQDFGHTIIVRNLRTFRYDEYGITGKDFLGQHQKAVSTIKSTYERYDLFLNFLQKYYFPIYQKKF